MSFWKKVRKAAKKVAPYVNPYTAAASVASEVLTGKSLLHHAEQGVKSIKGMRDAPTEAARIQEEAARRAAEIEGAATEQALTLQREYSEQALAEQRAFGEQAVGERRAFGERAVTGLEAQQQAVRGVYDPYRKDAGRAFQLQQAFSGALGKEAQEKAYAGFVEAPGTAFLRSQGMRGLETQLGAAGRGGGSRLKAVSEFNQQLALQDFEKQFARLGGLTQTELQAAGKMTGLTTGLEQARAQALLGTGAGLAGDISLAGREQAGLLERTGAGLAQTEMVGAGLLSESEMAAAAARAGGIRGQAQMTSDIIGGGVKLISAVAPVL